MNEQAGKLLIAAGIVLVAAGLVLIFGKSILPGRLPGDIHIQKDNFFFYFPLTTCIIISVLVSLIFFLLGKR
ncbi:MAG: DUF2905 domain-containing protein [Spirochaetia bacterium]|nr:DUF2905 domain-containing protein [Spirochaetia bacterium]